MSTEHPRGRRAARIAAAIGCAALGALGVANAGAGCLAFDDKQVPQVEPPTTSWSAPDVSYLELDHAVKACRWVLECPHLAGSLTRSMALPVDAASYSLCLHWLAGPIAADRPGLTQQRALLAEVASATSCSEALAAAWAEELDVATDVRCLGPTKCVGDTAVDCQAGTATRCKSPAFPDGASCVSSTFGARCSSGACDDGAPAACTGDALFNCVAKVELPLQCDALGLKCGQIPTVKSDYCLPNTGFFGQCSAEPEAPRCGGGTRVEVCFGEHLGATYDCGDIPDRTCAVDGPARCVRSQPVCRIGDADVDVCAGADVRACVDGQRIRVPCAEQGLTCIPSANGISAHCGAAPE